MTPDRNDLGKMLKQERIFRISGNNKGLMCPFKGVVCQEGSCTECQIYLDWQKLRGKKRYRQKWL